MDSSKMELGIIPAYQHVTWRVEGFLHLPRESGSFLDSPVFLFHGDRYCVRLYPEGESERGNVTEFHVRRVSSNSNEREVCCDIGLRRRLQDGDEWYEYCRRSLEENSAYERSWIEEDRDEYVPDGSLTVVCCMSLESGADSSAPGEGEQGGFPGHNAYLSTLWISPEMELATESPCTRVELIVDDFLDLPREEVESLASPEFRFAGDTFRLRFCRNADTGDAELRLLRVTSTFAQRTVLYRVGYRGIFGSSYPRSSRSLVGSSGLCLSLSEIKEQRGKYVLGSTLFVVLFLHLGEESGTSDAARERGGRTGFHKLQSDYGQLLQKGAESDASVVVRGKEFRVHRAVLRARSTVFEAMFGHDTAEKESGRVVVDDLDPDCFGPFLEYLYTGDVGAGLSDVNAFGLYVAADKYDVATLKSECVDHMRGNLSVDSFCDVVSLALRHREDDLLQEAVRFFRDHMPDILVTPKWLQFLSENVTDANELLIKAAMAGKQ